MLSLVNTHVTWLRAAGRSPRTIASRRRLLLHADEHLPYGLDEAHTDEIAFYLADPEWGAWSRHTYFGHLVGYYRWAYAAEHLSINPMRTLLRPPEGDRVPDPCTDEELAAALTLPPQPWGMAVRLAAYAGLRCCEIVAVRREDCNPQMLRVVGKGGRMRTVSMTPALWAYIQDRPPGRLCVGARGGPLTAQVLSQMQAAVWRRLGQPTQHLHRMRHWFATSLLANGADIRTVQELMGHKSIISTQYYTEVVNTQRDAAVRLLPDVRPEPVDARLGPTAEAA